MRMTELFNLTLRPKPELDILPGNQFLERAGWFHRIENGIFSKQPLAILTQKKIENQIRQELSKLTAQEVAIPYLSSENPVNFFNYAFYGNHITQTSDGSKKSHFSNLPLAGISDLVQHTVRSHRHLPRTLFQFGEKRFFQSQHNSGVFSSIQRTHADIISLCKNNAEAHHQFEQLLSAFDVIFKKCMLPISMVHFNYKNPLVRLGTEFVYFHPQGDTTLLTCPACSYRANSKYAEHRKGVEKNDEVLPLEKVHTPGTKTIADLSNFLEIPTSKTAKAVFMAATFFEDFQFIEKTVLAVVRGDQELNENKLLQALDAIKLRPAIDEEIHALGAVAGYGSPIGVKKGLIVVDDLIPLSTNLVAGANENDYHFKNVNYGRDYKADRIADIAQVQAGDPCPECQHPLEEQSGFVIARADLPSEAIGNQNNCKFQDEDGELKPILIGFSWIDLDRVLGSVAENSHDDYGLIVPYSLAPFQVHLVVLPSKTSSEPVEQAEQLYLDLTRTRIPVLFDDRKESPGVKFNDADLIGLPLRITIAEKTLSQGVAEFKLRSEKEKFTVPLEDVIPRAMQILLQMDRAILQNALRSE